MLCITYSFPYHLALNNLHKLLSNDYDLSVYRDLVHLTLNTTNNKIEDGTIYEINSKAKDKNNDDNLDNLKEHDVFIFAYGAVVTWGLDEKEQKEVCDMLENFAGDKLGAIDKDIYEYGYSKDPEKIVIENDKILLPNRKGVLDKLACSYGLAQSVKLGGFEDTIGNIISLTEHLPETLATTGRIPLSRKEIRKLMGKIFIERSSINLHLEFLDIPTFFWEHPELESLYQVIIDYVNQEKRVEVINRQLDVMHELLDMLGNELNNQHSSKLEWIIILLIFVEIVLTLAKSWF